MVLEFSQSVNLLNNEDEVCNLTVKIFEGLLDKKKIPERQNKQVGRLICGALIWVLTVQCHARNTICNARGQ